MEMRDMYRYSRVLLAFIILLLAACSQKKKQTTGEDEVDLTAFINYFPEQKLPYQLTDTTLAKKTADSLRISGKTIGLFVPDSLLRPFFGKDAKPQFYPLARNTVKDAETYLFLKAVQGAKREALLLVFEKDSFVTGLPLVQLNGPAAAGEQQIANMDSRYTLTLLRQRSGDGQLIYNKKVYVYNPEGLFTLILTESNDHRSKPPPLVNPIDTLKAAHKWAGDYTQDKRNIVSFRDGSKPGTLQVFVHFEKDNGQCRGEIKGLATVTGAHTLRFTESNGTCAIEFSFSGNTVRMKELEGCGSYRDIKCFFEGSYTRKKKSNTSPKPKKK